MIDDLIGDQKQAPCVFLAGKVFTSPVGPVGIFYLTLGFTSALFLHFIAMNLCANKKQSTMENNLSDPDSPWKTQVEKFNNL